MPRAEMIWKVAHLGLSTLGRAAGIGSAVAMLAPKSDRRTHTHAVLVVDNIFVLVSWVLSQYFDNEILTALVRRLGHEKLHN